MSDKVRRAGKPGRRSFLAFSTGLVTFVSGLIACNDTPTGTVALGTTPSAAERSAAGVRISNPNAYVGEGHNAMVNAVLRDVATKRSKGPSGKKLCKLVEESAMEYARANAKNPGYAVTLVKQQGFCPPTGVSGPKVSAGLASIAEGYGLSARATELLNLTDYLVGVSYSGAELQSYLNSVDAAAMSDLDPEESEIVLSATSVAVSSLDYWIANLASWQAQYGTAQPSYLRSDEGYSDALVTRKHSFLAGAWEVAKADLDGAISGGVGARLAKAAIPEAAMWVGGSKSLIKLLTML